MSVENSRRRNVEISDQGEIRRFETVPDEATIYLSAVRYNWAVLWTGGPSGQSKEEVVALLKALIGVEAARIYAVKVPLVGKNVPAA